MCNCSSNNVGLLALPCNGVCVLFTMCVVVVVTMLAFWHYRVMVCVCTVCHVCSCSSNNVGLLALACIGVCTVFGLQNI